jgi:lysozyme
VRSGARRSRRRSRRFVGWLLVLGIAVGGGFAVVALYDRGFIRPNNPTLADYPVRGVDVSAFQGEIDWPKLVSSGSLRFAFIKATEGTHTRDKRFLRNWSDARGRVARGAYHFFSFCSGGEEQAQNFLTFLPSYGELPPAVDVEFTGNCRRPPSFSDVREQLAIFISAVETATRRKPVIYASQGAYTAIISGHFGGYPLWIREVIGGPPVGQYPDLAFWQYAGNGRVDGVNKLIDLDAFIGAQKDFERLLDRGHL